MTTVMECSDTPSWTMNGEQTLAELDTLHHTLTRLSARRLDLLRHLDQLGHATDLGARDTTELLSLRHRLDPYVVRRDLRTAHALTRYPTLASRLPSTTPNHDADHRDADHRDDGDFSAVGHAPADGDLRTDGDLRGDDDVRDDSATDTDSGIDSDRGTDADSAIDTDTQSAVERHRRARIRQTILNADQAAVITAILDKAPPTVRPEDLAVAETELVIAARTLLPRDLKRLAPGVLNALDPDGSPPEAPAASDRAERLDPTERAHAAQSLWLVPGTASDPTGFGDRVRGLRFGGFLTREHAELFQVLVDAAAKPRKTPTGELDPRTLGQRRADAFTTILRAAAASGGEIPAHGGIKPHLCVTIPYTALTRAGRLHAAPDASGLPSKATSVLAREKARTGELTFGEPLPASEVRRIACDAGIIPIVLGSNSEPLDVGREQRLVTPSIRRALIARDAGCVIPGCQAPPGHCDAHHLQHWTDGGETAVHNLALVCPPDHRAIHRGTWRVTITNGHVHTTRPPWADPPEHAARRHRPPTDTVHETSEAAHQRGHAPPATGPPT